MPSINPAICEPTRFGALLYLAKHGGRAESRAMRLALGLSSRAVLTNHRKKLAAAGLIRAQGRIFELTPQGINALAAMASAIDGAIKTGRPAAT